MEDKVHMQVSPFFAETKKYQKFEQYLHHNHINPRQVPFTELSFRVCGYGYFDKYKQNMKTNFREYLWQSAQGCPELSVLKIIFNGFAVNSFPKQGEQQEQGEHILFDILESLEHIARKKKIKVFHFHTTNLRKCSDKDLMKLFSLINVFGEGGCEEISIQLADWEFQGGYPEYDRLVEMFTEFVAGKPEYLRFKKFRLEMSSWYMKEKDAYKVLSKTLTTEQLIEKFKKEQKPIPKDNNDKPAEQEGLENEGNETVNEDFPNIPVEQRQETVDALNYFLAHLDERYFHPKYAHKKDSDKYSNQQAEEHALMIEEMKRTEGIVSQRLVKYPYQFIMGLRVEEFHNKMTNFLIKLLEKMNQLQEYHIDMRNWNGMFSMGGLKKILDSKKVANKEEFSLIRKSLIGGNKPSGKEGDQLKTVYTM